MKYLMTFLTLLFSSLALAHDDHYLNDNVHAFYHVVFYCLLAALVARLAWWGVRQMRHKSTK